MSALAASIPQTVPQVRDLDHFDSIRTQLEDMKNFGEKLKLNELRMATIKDKIDIYSSQVDNFMEMPEVSPEEESKQAATVAAAVVYTAEEEDPIDVLVAANMTERFAGVSISR